MKHEKYRDLWNSWSESRRRGELSNIGLNSKEMIEHVSKRFSMLPSDIQDKLLNISIQERAIPLDDYPDTYLSVRKKEADAARIFNSKLAEVNQAVKSLRWQDIVFLEGSGDSSCHIAIPLLPEAVRDKMKELYRLDSRKAYTALVKSDKAFAKSINDSDPNTRNSIYMKVERQSHRSHFPDGIPDVLKGTHLGYKLYRALLQKYTWLTSNTAGTVEKDRTWQSIVSPKKDAQGNLTEDDVHAIVSSGAVFAMVKNIPNPEKIRLASAYLRHIESSSITARNFAIDPELKEILPDEVKAPFDPAQRARLAKERERAVMAANRARFELYAPFGLDAHDWEIGDYVVVKQYLMDTSYQNLPVRKVVAKQDGQWISLKISDLAQYEQTGRMSDTRTTNRKENWVKSQLVPGQFGYMVDPTAGRRAVAGTGAASTPNTTKQQGPRGSDRQDDVAEQTYQQRSIVKDFMRRNANYLVYVKQSAWDIRRTIGMRQEPIIAYLVASTETREGRRSVFSYDVINARTGARVLRNGNQAAFDDLGLVGFKQRPLQRKTGVAQGDWAFINKHGSYMGYVCLVYRVTPASNRQPGVYVWAGRQDGRPLYIGHPEHISKLLPLDANEADGIMSFADFKIITD